MTKYYRVWLNETFGYKKVNILNGNPIICKRNKFIEKHYNELVFVEIITGKIIYPNTSELRRKLTYEYKDTSWASYEPHYEEITSNKVKEWLEELNEQELKEYINKIYRLEQKAKECYDEEKLIQLENKNKEKSCNKSIRRTLRKIRNR